MEERSWKTVFKAVALILSLLALAVFQVPDPSFHIVACDVGQGDATLIIYKNSQILVDGGPDSKVLSCLGRHLPFWDREIELVVLTHPDSDHFAGLIEVFEKYKVDNYLYNPLSISKPEYKVLENLGGREGVKQIYPLKGRAVGVGLIRLDILSPSGDGTGTEKNQEAAQEIPDNATNDYSIVSLVSFGKFRMLLTGDMPPAVSDQIAASWNSGPVHYIKTPHHGSKHGMTQNLLKAVMPKLAVISVGKNMYGHPAHEILDMLNLNGIKYLRTDEKGDIEVVSDGEKYWIK
ncbi:MAG TPA: MBL fold metallo-hydrolase [Patescibacteria group bacterium]|nr:MBL fold metallo-hydrolase [Patescibacteria group bacterium]